MACVGMLHTSKINLWMTPGNLRLDFVWIGVMGVCVWRGRLERVQFGMHKKIHTRLAMDRPLSLEKKSALLSCLPPTLLLFCLHLSYPSCNNIYGSPSFCVAGLFPTFCCIWILCSEGIPFGVTKTSVLLDFPIINQSSVVGGCFVILGVNRLIP